MIGKIRIPTNNTAAKDAKNSDHPGYFSLYSFRFLSGHDSFNSSAVCFISASCFLCCFSQHFCLFIYDYSLFFQFVNCFSDVFIHFYCSIILFKQRYCLFYLFQRNKIIISVRYCIFIQIPLFGFVQNTLSLFCKPKRAALNFSSTALFVLIFHSQNNILIIISKVFSKEIESSNISGIFFISNSNLYIRFFHNI